jgi:magnesium-transporting ATPase (P-type)
MAESKKFGVKNIIVIVVLIITVAWAIMAISVEGWFQYTVSGGGASVSKAYAYGKLAANHFDKFDGYGAMVTFPILVIIFAVLTLAGYIVNRFIDNKIAKYVTIGVAALLIVFGILTIVFTYTYIYNGFMKGWTTEMKNSMHLTPIGAWMSGFAGIVGGAVGVSSSKNKKKLPE